MFEGFLAGGVAAGACVSTQDQRIDWQSLNPPTPTPTPTSSRPHPDPPPVCL